MKTGMLITIIVLIAFMYNCKNDDESCNEDCENYYASMYNNKSIKGLSKKIKVKVPFNPIEIASSTDGIIFRGNNVYFYAIDGEPEIPYQNVSILLPDDADIHNIQVSVDSEHSRELPGSYLLKTGSTALVCSRQKKIIENYRNNRVSNSSEAYPRDIIEYNHIKTGNLRGWKIIDIPITNFRYNQHKKQLFQVIDATIAIRYGLIDNSNRTVSSSKIDAIGRERTKNIVVNFNDMAKVYSHNLKNRNDQALTNEKPGYVIITRKDIQTNATMLNDFIIHKEQRGFKVFLITEEQWGGGVGDGAAENIRKWLQNNYIRLNVEYVLLIGDPDPVQGDVPMKMLYPRNNSNCFSKINATPTDAYYSELTGNWDLDGDNYYGEWSCDDINGDFGPGGIDNYFEIITGRIPLYNDKDESKYAVLDMILTKIISYQTADYSNSAWRKNVLLPMKEDKINHLQRYRYGEKIKDEILIPSGFTYHRVYDYDYDLYPAPETINFWENTVLDIWKQERFGLVVWATHGSSFDAQYVIDSDKTKRLDDAYPVFTFQASCLNSQPETMINLTYSLLKNGAIAAVGASRESWSYYKLGSDSPYNDKIAYEYVKNLVINEMSCGKSLHEIRQNVMPNSASAWMNLLVYNIYGDPEVGLYTSFKK